MKLEALAAQYASDPRIKALDKALGSKKNIVVKAYNAAGSSAALALSSIRRGGVPMLVVGDSADDVAVGL